MGNCCSMRKDPTASPHNSHKKQNIEEKYKVPHTTPLEDSNNKISIQQNSQLPPSQITRNQLSKEVKKNDEGWMMIPLPSQVIAARNEKEETLEEKNKTKQIPNVMTNNSENIHKKKESDEGNSSANNIYSEPEEFISSREELKEKHITQNISYNSNSNTNSIQKRGGGINEVNEKVVSLVSKRKDSSDSSIWSTPEEEGNTNKNVGESKNKKIESISNNNNNNNNDIVRVELPTESSNHKDDNNNSNNNNNKSPTVLVVESIKINVQEAPHFSNVSSIQKNSAENKNISNKETQENETNITQNNLTVTEFKIENLINRSNDSKLDTTTTNNNNNNNNNVKEENKTIEKSQEQLYISPVTKLEVYNEIIKPRDNVVEFDAVFTDDNEEEDNNNNNNNDNVEIEGDNYSDNHSKSHASVTDNKEDNEHKLPQRIVSWSSEEYNNNNNNNNNNNKDDDNDKSSLLETAEGITLRGGIHNIDYIESGSSDGGSERRRLAAIVHRPQNIKEENDIKEENIEEKVYTKTRTFTPPQKSLEYKVVNNLDNEREVSVNNNNNSHNISPVSEQVFNFDTMASLPPRPNVVIVSPPPVTPQSRDDNNDNEDDNLF